MTEMLGSQRPFAYLAHSMAAKIWLYTKPLLKNFCRLVIYLDSYIRKHDEEIEVFFGYLLEVFEMPVLVLGVFYGTLLSMFTGILAAAVILPYGVIAFWPMAFTVVAQLSQSLWQGLQQQLLILLARGTQSNDVYYSDDEHEWDLDNDGDSAVPGSLELDAESEQLLFHLDDMYGKKPGNNLGMAQTSPMSWKVSETLDESQSQPDLTRDLRINNSPVRRHRRTGTGSSASSLELVRTPLMINSEARNRYSRHYRSGSSSPEASFHMAALDATKRAQSATNLLTHYRSRSASTSTSKSISNRRTELW